MPTILSRKPGGGGGGGAPSGPAGGDLSGTYPNPTLDTGIGVYDQIEDLQLGGAGTFDFQTIPQTFTHLLIEYQVRATNGTAVQVSMRFNNDSSAIYNWQNVFGNNTTASATANAGDTALKVGTCPGSGADAGFTGSASIKIFYYRQTTFFKDFVSLARRNDGTVVADSIGESLSGVWRATTAISRVTLTPSAGTTFVTGSRATLYGLG